MDTLSVGKHNNKPKCKNNLDYNFDDSETVGLGSISRAVFVCNPQKRSLLFIVELAYWLEVKVVGKAVGGLGHAVVNVFNHN